MNEPALSVTPLHQLHQELGGRLVPFAGWELPIQYEGVVAEHRWCRTSAALFDVSHMATFEIANTGANATALESLTPANIKNLANGRSRYGLFTTADGGILDDFIISRVDSALRIVSNASRRTVVAQLLDRVLPADQWGDRTDVALLAVQGPAAAQVVGQLSPEATALKFMQTVSVELAGVSIAIGRSGYTGEDGFELTVPEDKAEAFARRLLDSDLVRPAGLGARDSLRLEAGLCLYGNDIDESTSPIEASLGWSIGKRRRSDADFPGAKTIIDQLESGAERSRVGIRATGRRPVRDGTELTNTKGEPVGTITSGGYGPTLDAPVAMAYVSSDSAVEGTQLIATVRDKAVECAITSLPFLPSNYFRG